MQREPKVAWCLCTWNQNLVRSFISRLKVSVALTCLLTLVADLQQQAEVHVKIKTGSRQNLSQCVHIDINKTLQTFPNY